LGERYLKIFTFGVLSLGFRLDFLSPLVTESASLTAEEMPGPNFASFSMLLSRLRFIAIGIGNLYLIRLGKGCHMKVAYTSHAELKFKILEKHGVKVTKKQIEDIQS
jgi:hypothetical protein